jgi:hypothetical protein
MQNRSLTIAAMPRVIAGVSIAGTGSQVSSKTFVPHRASRTVL